MIGIIIQFRKLLAVAALLAVLLIPASVARAASAGCNDNDPKTACNILDTACPAGSTAVLCQENKENQTTSDNSLYGPSGIITRAVNIISILAGIASVIMVIIGGILYALSSGDSARINTAKNTILFAIIGVVIATLAQAIIRFVLVRIV